MKQKEKAKELFDKYFEVTNNYYQAKQCALIAVDEILKALPTFELGLQCVAKIQYWREVKKEIESL
jgi:hypothetical protein